MPAELVKREYEKRYRDAGILRYNFDFMWNLIRDMANDFNVSRVAMGYRLENLGLIDKYGENILQLK
jgi:Zn-dependent peptidase ImmA (M78 family)